MLFVFFLLALFRLCDRIFSLGTLLVVIGYLITLNVVNTEQLIAGANVERYLNASDKTTVDTCYLRTLSIDALPAMLKLYHDSSEPAVRAQAAGWLRGQLDALDRLNEHESPLTFNLSRANARAQLEPLRAGIEVADTHIVDPYVCGREW